MKDKADVCILISDSACLVWNKSCDRQDYE